MDQKWGWYHTLYFLAGERIEKMESITKLGIHECLTYLCYKQDESEIKNVNYGGKHTI